MKTIIVASDFSVAAANAANYAADLALAINADLLLLNVYQIPVAYLEVPIVVSFEDLQKNAEESLNNLKKELLLSTAGKIKIDIKVEEGVFFEELKKICKTIMPYAVVMGCQGTTASERFFFGSHAVHAMKHLTWPLITVPTGIKFSGIKKIGLACDFNKVQDTTPVDEIKTLINDFKAALHVLNTGKKSDYNPDLVFQSGLLQEMLANLKPKYHFITDENIDEGILNFTEKNNINLLITLPKRHSLPDKLIHKSHTKHFVLHSHVPVMALHA